MTLNGLQPVCQAFSYLESPSLLPFDPATNGQNTPDCWGRGNKRKHSSESNNCKGNEFQNPEEDTSLRPPYLGGKEGRKKRHHIRGTIQLAFLPSVVKGAPGRNQKFCPIKEVFKDVMFSLPPPLPPFFITTAYKLATHEHIDLLFWFSYKKQSRYDELKQHLADAAVTDTPVTLNQLCLAAYPWHFHCLLSFFAQLLDSDQGW